ncbi:hypothetical protein BN136_1054 [Cronobacter universalis NCTC 9529]|nr:hypothetical protein BN136_1054 [Cronobacter universalis NCTC 9529]
MSAVWRTSFLAREHPKAKSTLKAGFLISVINRHTFAMNSLIS